MDDMINMDLVETRLHLFKSVENVKKKKTERKKERKKERKIKADFHRRVDI